MNCNQKCNTCDTCAKDRAFQTIVYRIRNRFPHACVTFYSAKHPLVHLEIKSTGEFEVSRYVDIGDIINETDEVIESILGEASHYTTINAKAELEGCCDSICKKVADRVKIAISYHVTDDYVEFLSPGEYSGYSAAKDKVLNDHEFCIARILESMCNSSPRYRACCESICDMARERHGLNVEYKIICDRARFNLSGQKYSIDATKIEVFCKQESVIAQILELEKERLAQAGRQLKSACESISETIRKRYGLNVMYQNFKDHIQFCLDGKTQSAYTTHRSNVLDDRDSVIARILLIKSGKERLPDTNKPKCENCAYGDKCSNATSINCRRYPEIVTQALADWCGEFRRKDTGTVTDPSRWHKTDLYDVQQRCKTDLYYYGNE